MNDDLAFLESAGIACGRKPCKEDRSAGADRDPMELLTGVGVVSDPRLPLGSHPSTTGSPGPKAGVGAEGRAERLWSH